MSGGERQKILGAGVIGLALVAAAYTISHFGEKTPLPANISTSGAPTRTAIKTDDKDNNGIEDWRDAYVQAKPILLDKSATSSYTLPSTLTGKVSIDFFKSYIQSKNAGSFGKSNEQLVLGAAKDLTVQASDELFDTKDIIIMENWSENDVKLYANTMGGILLASKAPSHQNELLILKDIVTSGNSARISELKPIAQDYEMFRDESLKIPVPNIFVKQHLDLINSYAAMATDVTAMTLAFDDPLLSLIRLQRYQDDALGLALSLQNFNYSISPYGSLFTKDDPAVFFSQFDQNNQKQ